MARRLAAAVLAAALLGACHARKAPPAPAPGAPAAADPAKAAAAAKERAAEIQRLYDAGVSAYAKGDMPLARTLFERVLKLDPSHTPSQRALRRITLER